MLEEIIPKKPMGNAIIIPPGNKQNNAASIPSRMEMIPKILILFCMSILQSQNYQFFSCYCNTVYH